MEPCICLENDLPGKAEGCCCCQSWRRCPPSTVWEWGDQVLGILVVQWYCHCKVFSWGRWGSGVMAPRRRPQHLRLPFFAGPCQSATRSRGWRLCSTRRFDGYSKRTTGQKTTPCCYSWWSDKRFSGGRGLGWGWQGISSAGVVAAAAAVAGLAVDAGSGKADRFAQRNYPRRRGWHDVGSSGKASSRLSRVFPGKNCRPRRLWFPWTKCSRTRRKARKEGHRSPAAGGESSTRAGSATPSVLCPCCCCWRCWALKLPGCSRLTGSQTPMKCWARMTGSGWKEEGLLASDLADGDSALCFCPSVNHPAWFAELQWGERETMSYYYCCSRSPGCCCSIWWTGTSLTRIWC